MQVLTTSNLGPGHARNYGFVRTNSKYIAFLDQDDLWLPDKLKLQVEYLENNKDQSGVLCDFMISKNSQKGLVASRLIRNRNLKKMFKSKIKIELIKFI